MLFTVYLVVMLNMLDLDLVFALRTIVSEAGSYLHVATAQVTRYFHGVLLLDFFTPTGRGERVLCHATIY